jgi:cAMP-dependent protein kinase regulator
VVDVSPKDEQTLQTLHSAIRSCFIFNGITETEEQSIVAAMHPHTIKEGEIDNSLSDMYFVCTKGQLFVTSGSREETLNPGDSFGELSLLYRTSSQVKVEANEDCVIYCLERESYKKVIVSASAKSIKENYAFLKR